MKLPDPRLNASLTPELGDQQSRFFHELVCRESRVCRAANRVMPRDLEDFATRILLAHNVPDDEARTTARVLVAANLRGKPIHGVGRLPALLAGIKAGTVKPGVTMEVSHPAPAIGIVDASSGLGQVAGELAMREAIGKAEECGVGVVTVKRSNDFGIAGHYALMAVDAGLVGIAMTNTPPLVVPTGGAEISLGANPIALGAPAIRHAPFLLDMATAATSVEAIEACRDEGRQMPRGWAVDEQGYDCVNPGQVLRNLAEGLGGGVLPLGGRGDRRGGQRGFGLSLMIDVLSGVLSGAGYGTGVGAPGVGTNRDETAGPNVGHFFLAIDIARFMPLYDFVTRMDDLILRIEASRHATGNPTIVVHGEKEFARTHVHAEVGVPLAPETFDTLIRIAAGAEIAPPLVTSKPAECRYGNSPQEPHDV
jgi:L-2-hydroxycarboxylate dehydrogenase (NAD+)